MTNSLPIHPGQPIYILEDDDTITTETVQSVGVSDKGELIVNDGWYFVGDEAFLSREDALLAIEGKLSENYGFA